VSTRAPFGFCLSDWKRGYESGALAHDDLIAWVEGFDRADPAWIGLASTDVLEAQLARLPERRERASAVTLPLDGVPFAIKDNIDAAGWTTTAACPAFSRLAHEDASIVARLLTAGAILVGKTNLDQFATGLVGTRSPFGAVPSSFDPTRIGGGSSSGSAAVVARGLVPFALGTDTAGSGRVPAALHNVVGYKPTRGRFSTRGLVPACRTLDCPSIFALTVDDAAEVAGLLDHYDELDPFACRTAMQVGPLAHIRIAVPDQLEFFGDDLAEAAFAQARAAIAAVGFELSSVDFRPFRALADLLYAASWVAERSLVAGSLLDAPADAMDPIVRRILLEGRRRTAEEAFAAEYRRAELAREIDRTFDRADVLLVPTTPTVYRLSEVAAEPILTNARLGTYTNFTNLADLCALAIPGPFRADQFPAGITLLARAHHERWLVDLGRRLEAEFGLPLGASGRQRTPVSAAIREVETASDCLTLAVVGAHLSGMPLCSQLTSRGATLRATQRTAPVYQLRVLAGSGPVRPGLFRMDDGSTYGAIEVELWDVPRGQVGSFLELVPPPLGLGSIQLFDGSWVRGFICEPWGRRDSIDITHFGGFRAFIAARTAGATNRPVDPA
jgi:allophanate hydrolase